MEWKLGDSSEGLGPGLAGWRGIGTMVQEVWVLSWAEGKLGDRSRVSVLAGWRGCRMIVQSPQSWAGWRGCRMIVQQPSVLGWLERMQDDSSAALSPGLVGEDAG